MKLSKKQNLMIDYINICLSIILIYSGIFYLIMGITVPTPIFILICYANFIWVLSVTKLENKYLKD